MPAVVRKADPLWCWKGGQGVVLGTVVDQLTGVNVGEQSGGVGANSAVQRAIIQVVLPVVDPPGQSEADGTASAARLAVCSSRWSSPSWIPSG